MTKIEDPLRHLLVLIRSNFIVLGLTAIIGYVLDFKDYFGYKGDEKYYLAISDVVIFLLIEHLKKMQR